MNDDDDITRNYHGGHRYSVEAGEQITNKARDLDRICRAIHARTGLTSDECDVLLYGGIGHQTCSARFTDAKAMGLTVERGWRLTRKKRKAAVHYLTDKGRVYIGVAPEPERDFFG